MRPAIRPFLMIAAAVLALAGCATPPPASDPDALADYRATNDPLEPTNRVFYAINNGIDTVILRPVAVGYHDVLPQPVRNSIHNVLVNLSTPVTFADDVLQTKPRRAGDRSVMSAALPEKCVAMGFAAEEVAARLRAFTLRHMDLAPGAAAHDLVVPGCVVLPGRGAVQAE